MNELLVSAALLLAVPTVVDGDTVKVANVSIRLTDYDTPELFHPRCAREYQLAQDAKHELERIADKLKLTLVPCATKNHGRLCAQAQLPDKPLAEHMISSRLASPYICGPNWCPRKIDWCR
jgi:endonuclease YncB( thermonuclease family)